MPLAMRFTPKKRNSTVITASLCMASHSFAESSCVFAIPRMRLAGGPVLAGEPAAGCWMWPRDCACYC
jgi:hypothetical protein